ncbi:glutaredoxin domain-containing cysteine-rich protein CG12206 [Trichonephila inaurata madagascariensis]|uniref:Glutaredoxin domain-containing cysteine-rich protein CG12206 n=1 Tax=Trichonephila inaurata madagascariensis TaxID=2747483 RepID=A0A8X6JYN2_9ARAC|nr:glutaredoxin domain-containing cysteine-rich protein CG12206 [Trichonephila inaurata madagascariensis]
MLASEPPSSRIHTGGGGISVRVNGAAVDSAQPAVDGSVERLSGNVSSKDKTLNSSEWAKATITWRTGAQRFSDGSSSVQQHNNSNASSSIDINGISSPPQLVHVIRVKSSQDDTVISSENMEQNGNVASTPVNQAKICIKNPPCIGKTVDYSKDKISVVVGSSVNHIIKGEDERSSSGASSAPGSDCERSDSDREADDGTDSGFSPSRRHCARVSVRTNNANNQASLTSQPSCGENYNENMMKNNVVCNGKSSNVRLTIASYSDKESENKNVVFNEGDPWDMHFHMRELDNAPEDKKADSEDVQTKIATAHALLSGNGDGTFSFKNRVRSSIVSLLVQSTSNRNYDQEEVGRIVFYTTSMGIVRTTFERCRKVRKILETLMVKFEERDVFMNRGFQQEVRERLGLTRVIVPQVFVEGRHLGGAEVVEQLNEIGHLRELVRPYKKQSVGGVCQQCGGYRYLLCPVCGGSKKSVTHRHHFSEDLVALRCVTCDESGLIRCQQCITGEV